MIKKAIILAMFMGVFTMNAQDTNLPDDLYGTWGTTEGEFLQISYDNTFKRRNATEILAYGRVYFEDGTLKVERFDTKETYNLSFFVGRLTFAVYKPNSDTAWLFEKISN